MNDIAAPVKKTTRKRVSTVAQTTAEPMVVSASAKNLKGVAALFTELFVTITEDKALFDTLQKEISEIRQSWGKEQARHETEVRENQQQEDLARRREREAYEYETAKMRRQAEDEFAERKAKWEKELAGRKEEIENQKEELEALRKQVGGFEAEKEKVIKETSLVIEKRLQDMFAAEKKLREQEIKAEKEVFDLRITNLSNENARQAKEIVEIKQALENATRQLKDIAVKVIESSNTSSKIPPVA